MTKDKKAITTLRNGLKKFREDALKEGWEEDEIDAKITEVYEDFPWYKYNAPKKSFLSKLFHILLFAFIVYLAVGAVLQRNKRWKKRVDDMWFDSQISYHSLRVMRVLTLPLFKVYDLSKFYEAECLIENPFKKETEIDCQFCEGIEHMPTLSAKSPDVADMIAESEPLVLKDVPVYIDKKVSFVDFQNMFKENKKELDEAVCKIERTEEFHKMSDFFEKMDEAKMVEQNVSVEWSNCDTYGTRFYRKLFPRPLFVAKESEIYFEKRVYMLQKDQNSTFPVMGGNSIYLYQVQGESTLELVASPKCDFNCTTTPITAAIKTGYVAIFPNNGWTYSFKTLADGLNIAFLSSFS